MKRFRVALLLLLFFLFAAPRARAQGTSGLHFGVEGGISYPQGDTKDSFDNGWNGGALLVWNPPVIPVGLRVDGSYHKLDAGTATSGNAEVLAGTANVVVGFRAILLKPYFLAGVGAYRLDFSEASGPSVFRGKSNETGWNAGAGVSISLRKIDLIVEARYHSVSTQRDRFKFVPISVGLVF
ncbi:MAG TPA: outer membrane beta-barrel protein [Thermoanaerobaculia bacterium]|jgi:opacity protein-like surface antigen